MAVGLVIVSHSHKIAEGVVDLAAQMASGVQIIAAGGLPGGEIGTDFETIQTALNAANSGDGVVVMTDLGSAVLTTDTVLDFLDEAEKANIRVSTAPIVEGSIAAAVSAAGGATLDEVLAAGYTAASEKPANEATVAANTKAASDSVSETVKLVNQHGLHARPASELVKFANGTQDEILVNGVGAKSLLQIVGLGLVAGDEVKLEVSGATAPNTLAELTAMFADGFGEE